MVGSNSNKRGQAHWLLAELTYACPLQCPYCSNPVDYAKYKDEMTTADWIKVFREARKMGATQLGLSGGEPLVRQDLEELITEASKLGFYTNLITSGIGLNKERIQAFKTAGLDHIQISFQSSEEDLNNFIAGTDSFKHKLEMAREVKAQGYPMVLCFVLHRLNIHQTAAVLERAIELKADYVELATTQYYGWALKNREQLLPSREQLESAEAVAHEYQEKLKGKMEIFYVVPDYYENRPKPCMNGWGSVFLTVTPDGKALPCHAARDLPGLEFPDVRENSIDWIWNESPVFNEFRGFDWMKEPCRSCDEKEKDFGGCRCQAYLLTGDARNADPVCDKSPYHEVILEATRSASTSSQLSKANEVEVIFRNTRNSKKLSPSSN